MHKAIHDELITIETISNKIDNIALTNLEQPDTSRLGQLICSGLLRLLDLIINGVLLLKRSLVLSLFAQPINLLRFEPKLSISEYFLQKLIKFNFALNVLKCITACVGVKV